MSRLRGKYAVVTGAAKGIGKAIAARFVNEGVAGIAVIDYNAETLHETAKELKENGALVIDAQCDVSNALQVREVMGNIMNTFGTVDILVNNAGIIRDSMFHKMTEDQWCSVMNTDLNSLFYVTKCVIQQMREKRSGNIINVSSIAAGGNLGQTNYSAAKAGVIAFTVALAKESAQKNIRVNCISPGFINTDILKEMPEDILAESINGAPFGRLGSPDEIAKVAVFLASDESSFVSGENITVSSSAKIS